MRKQSQATRGNRPHWSSAFHLMREMEQHGYSDQELAALVGVPVVDVVAWVAGERFPGTMSAELLGALFGVDPGLFRESERGAQADQGHQGRHR